MKEIHGVVAKKSPTTVLADNETAVRIYDADNSIFLCLPADRNALLTSEEARYLAKCLLEAASRLDKKQNA